MIAIQLLSMILSALLGAAIGFGFLDAAPCCGDCREEVPLMKRIRDWVRKYGWSFVFGIFLETIIDVIQGRPADIRVEVLLWLIVLSIAAFGSDG